MEIIRRALTQESFSFEGEFFRIPVPGIPDRGSTVSALTLVPRPLYPYEIWQAVTSPPTLEYVPVVGHGAVFWNQHYSFIKRFWDKYAETYERTHGVALAAHEKRMLVVATRVEDTYEKARETALAGHDEFWKFLGPYGWSRGYMGEDGKPAKPGLIPTLDESIENKTILLGSPEQVAEGIQFYRELLGVEHLTIFPHFLGDSYNDAPYSEQRATELQLRRRELEADLDEVTARIASLGERINAERRRVNRLGEAVVHANVKGRLRELLAADGERVQRGEDLARLVDCDSTIVTLSVAESVYNRLEIGDEAEFRVNGETIVHKGTVSRLAGSGAGPVRPGSGPHAGADPSPMTLRPWQILIGGICALALLMLFWPAISAGLRRMRGGTERRPAE